MNNKIKIDLESIKSKQLILSCLQDSDIAKAETLAKAWLEKDANSITAQYLFALVLISKQEHARAIELLVKVHEKDPNDAVVLTNLGLAYHKNKQLDEAELSFKKAITINADYDQAKYNLVCVYLDQESKNINKPSEEDTSEKEEQKKGDQALELLNELLQKNNSNAEYMCARADALRILNRWPQSLRQYRRSLRLDENNLRANMNIAPILLNMGKAEDAVEHSKKAITVDSKQIFAHKNLGDALMALEQLDEAMDAYADAFELDPNSTDLCIAIARGWLEVSNFNEAGFWFERALDIDSENVTAKAGIALITQEMGNNLQSIEMIEPLLDQEPNNIELRIILSDALWEEGDAQGAIEHLREVLKIQPNRVATHAKIGQLLSSAGDVDAALEEYKIALSQQKNNIPALSGMANTLRGKLDPEYAEKMENLLQRPKMRDGTKASLHNGLGFYYDGIKDYEKSAQHIKLANEFQWASKYKRGWEYESAQQEKHIDKLINSFTPEFFEKVKGWGVESETPVFIVAMPRSGTTLTEQILARHEKALGLGERNFASQSFQSFIRSPKDNLESFENLDNLTQGVLRKIGKRYLNILDVQKEKADSPDVERVVDKMPDNYSLVGWIAAVFPNAKIIHINRDHRDVALSSWMTQFGSIRWACSEEHLIERFRQYRRIMAHWRNTIPDRFIEINYEDLVANQESESKRLVEYIGLEWDESCLKFYESDRLVRTASATQVRQPIHNKSVAKWKHYEKLIPSLFDPLTEMLEGK
jgi:tetratricopeptide (TPR) repeat protein